MAACIQLLLFLCGLCLGLAGKSMLDCDFETSCHYTQDKTDTDDWQLNRGKTATASTGPSTDHTLQTEAGHYIYLETSGTSGKPINNARLFSPSFIAQHGQCLSFYYSMYGEGIGALNVNLDHVDPVKGNVIFSAQVWSRKGEQSVNESDWLHAVIPIDSGDGSKVRFTFEAVKGSSYHGDIAIDDILLDKSCKVPVDPPTLPPTTTTPGPLTSNVPSLAVTGDVHIQASPASMHAQFTKHLTVNCSYTHGNGSDFNTLVSLLLSMKNSSGQSDFTELATITAFSNDQLTVKNNIGAEVKGHLVATGQSYISFEWLYPSEQVVGEYRCQGFGLDHDGHPRVSAMTTQVSHLVLNCETVLPKYKDTDLKLDAVKAKINNLMGTLLEASDTYNNHTYFLSRPLALDVQLGSNLCDVSGGYLVEVNDQSEFAFLVNFTESALKDNVTSGIVLGSSNDGHPSEWTFLSSAVKMSYFDWLDGPSKIPNTNCLFFDISQKMYSDICKGEKMTRVVCEMSL